MVIHLFTSTHLFGQSYEPFPQNDISITFPAHQLETHGQTPSFPAGVAPFMVPPDPK